MQAFAADLGARRALGEDGWQAALAARVEDRDQRRAARDNAYANSQLVDVASLDDLGRNDLHDLLGGMVRHIFVRRRPRGANAEDRTLIVWSDDPRVVEVPGPHKSAIFEHIEW